uniref:Uncharacterized protein n=1 Tax=Rhizophora mucronata TaxID=61149 RepID=A0A2P2MQT3_RHIMU
MSIESLIHYDCMYVITFRTFYS